MIYKANNFSKNKMFKIQQQQQKNQHSSVCEYYNPLPDH